MAPVSEDSEIPLKRTKRQAHGPSDSGFSSKQRSRSSDGFGGSGDRGPQVSDPSAGSAVSRTEHESELKTFKEFVGRMDEFLVWKNSPLGNSLRSDVPARTDARVEELTLAYSAKKALFLIFRK